MGGVWKAWGDERGLLLRLALHGRERHGHPIHPPTRQTLLRRPLPRTQQGATSVHHPRGPGSYPATQSSADAETPPHTHCSPGGPRAAPGPADPAPCWCLAPWRAGGLAVRGWCGSKPEWPVNAQGPQAGTRELAHVGPPTPTLLFLVKTIWGGTEQEDGLTLSAGGTFWNRGIWLDSLPPLLHPVTTRVTDRRRHQDAGQRQLDPRKVGTARCPQDPGFEARTARGPGNRAQDKAEAARCQPPDCPERPRPPPDRPTGTPRPAFTALLRFPDSPPGPWGRA